MTMEMVLVFAIFMMGVVAIAAMFFFLLSNGKLRNPFLSSSDRFERGKDDGSENNRAENRGVYPP